MGDAKIARRRVAKKPALDMVIHTPARHPTEAHLHHRLDASAARAGIDVQQEMEQLDMREFGLAPETAEVVVKGFGRCAHNGRRGLRIKLTLGSGFASCALKLELGDAARELQAIRRVGVEVADLPQEWHHSLRRYVRAASQNLALGR